MLTKKEMILIFKMKKCFKCGASKEMSEFYKHPATLDGYLNKCKKCTKADIKLNVEKNRTNVNWIESRKKSARKWQRQNVSNSKTTSETRRKYIDKFPEKRRAMNASQRIIKAGYHKHHWSYNDEHFKDVIWLTNREHNKAHRFIVYDQERKMYRRFDTNELLDTKEHHNDFISLCILTRED